MRILFWTAGFWPCIGGIETQGFLFVKALQEKGHSCLVLAQKDFPDLKDEEVHEGISIRRFDFKGVLVNRGADTLGSIKTYLESVAKTFQPEILHLYTCMGEAAIVFSMLKNVFSAPRVLTVHAPHYGHKIVLSVQTICSQVDQICCVSKWVFREMEQRLPETKDRLRLIYNGLPLFKVPPSPLCFSPPVLLMLGRLSPEKGFRDGILAFSLLKKMYPSAKLLIAGDGIERPALENLTSQLGLSDSVEFTGALKREEIPHAMNRATLVVVYSHFESFGLVALEAMQMGRPVVASNVGGLPEIISSSDLGSLVPPQDAHALCEAIQDLLTHPEKTIQIGINARKYAVNHFTIDKNADQYESLYNDLKTT